MSGLAAVMEQSLARANRHTAATFGARPMSSRQVYALVRRHGVVALATVKPSGRPHISLTGMVAFKGSFYLGEARQYAAFRNLRRNPHIAVVVNSGGWGSHVLMEGEARVLAGRDPRNGAIAREEEKRFGWSYPVHVELVPAKVFTWAG